MQRKQTSQALSTAVATVAAHTNIERNLYVNYFICNIYVAFNANCERQAF